MKGFLKGMCLTAVAILMFGILFSIVGFAMGGSFQSFYHNGLNWIFNDSDFLFSRNEITRNDWQSDKEYAENKAVISDKITSLNFSLGACKAYVREGDEFSYNITGTDVNRFKISSENGEFNIAYEGKAYLENIDIKVEITVPKDAKFDNVDFTIGAGKMEIDGIETQDADFTVGAGTMKVNDFVAKGESDIEVGAASFELSGDLQGSTDISVGMGTAEISLIDVSDLGYSIEVGLGSVSVPDRSVIVAGELSANENAKRFFNIDCGMGTVDIKSK